MLCAQPTNDIQAGTKRQWVSPRGGGDQHLGFKQNSSVVRPAVQVLSQKTQDR